jgi:hypothetical protein
MFAIASSWVNCHFFLHAALRSSRQSALAHHGSDELFPVFDTASKNGVAVPYNTQATFVPKTSDVRELLGIAVHSRLLPELMMLYRQ